MRKSNLLHVYDYLETTGKQYWSKTLLDGITELAFNFFDNTDDYVDIDAMIHDPATDKLNSAGFRSKVTVCGNTYFRFTFDVRFDKNEDVTEQKHVVYNLESSFFLNGVEFSLTDHPEMRSKFLKHIQSTGICFLMQ